MALYLGGTLVEKLVCINGQKHKVKTTVINSKLKTFDGYILKDENNLFITSTEEDENKWH